MSCWVLTFLLWQIEAADVGKIYKIRIGHDGKGIGDGWFLESVTLKRLAVKINESDKKKKKKKKSEEVEEEEAKAEEVMDVYTFVAHRWLAKDEGDKELVVELVPDGESALEGKYQRECACVHGSSSDTKVDNHAAVLCMTTYGSSAIPLPQACSMAYSMDWLISSGEEDSGETGDRLKCEYPRERLQNSPSHFWRIWVVSSMICHCS